jgi:hypothetical protein
MWGWYGSIMSAKAQAILDEIRTLPISDQRALLLELGERIGQASAPASGELYGEPLTDEDIEQSARVTFQMLDEEEKRAGSR